MIERSSPDVGYIDPEMFAQIGVSQAVKAGGLVFYSGIVAARPDAKCACPGDGRAQLQYVLDLLGKMLEYDNLSYANLVSTTTYTIDINILRENGDLYTAAFIGHPPCSTWIEVKGLTDADYLLEMVAVAAL